MGDSTLHPGRLDDAEQLKRALAALRALRARVAALEAARAEPVAVIGMGCRLPGGVDGPDDLWALLRDGVDAITPVPPDRWDGAALAAADPELTDGAAVRWGGFLPAVDGFDAGFFGISPREAERMDPQQRLLLEVAFEALEAAGQPIDRLAGGNHGVFVGIHSHSSDYTWLQIRRPEDIDPHTATGTAHSIAANRLSYLFDWHGPSLAVDTACSSALVAVHLAVQSLRRHECELALAGGVNLMLSPEVTIAFDRLRMLSPDGRCKTFDAGADGMVRAEGCGLVVLKRLADAVAADDAVLAVIRGSAVNQDGRTNSLTAPSGTAQAAVIRQALADADVRPEAIGLVEAHGTGTALGDPIEVEALAGVLGRSSAGTLPCFLGAIKTNLGHLEAAAGIAGLLKVVLALKHGMVPPNLHFSVCNPHIDLTGTRLRIPTRPEPWPRGDRPRYAAVSSFGFGGTNAHVVVGEAPAPAAPAEAGELRAAQDASAAIAGGRGAYLLPLSARSSAALDALARRWRDRLTPGDAPIADLAATAARRRTHHAQRLAVVGSRTEICEALDALAEGRPSAVIRGEAWPESRRGLAFVFTGQGPLRPGVGLDLLGEAAAFREVIEACDRLLRDRAGWSLIDALGTDTAASRLDLPEVVQPARFALQVGLAALWRSWGIQPEAVVGHSLGEVAAAHVAGALSLEDAVCLVEARGRLMRGLIGKGRMVAVGLAADEAEELVARHAGRFSIAAINGPMSTVLSGDASALEAAVAEIQDRAVFVRWLPLDTPFHSPAVDAVRKALVAELESLVPSAPAIPVYSTVWGARAEAGDFDAAYWGRNVRQTVRFAPAVAAMAATGINTWLEVGPHPELGPAIEQTVAVVDPPLVLGSLRRDEPGRPALMRTLGALYVHGYPIDWAALCPNVRTDLSLPAYPWQRQRYWLAPGFERAPAVADLLGADAAARGWLHEVAWEPAPPPEQAVTAPMGHPAAAVWLIFADRGGLGAAVAARLRERGDTIVMQNPEQANAAGAGSSVPTAPEGTSDGRGWIETAAALGRLTGVLYARGLDDTIAADMPVAAVAGTVADRLGDLTELVKAIDQDPGPGQPRLWIVTQSAQAVPQLSSPQPGRAAVAEPSLEAAPSLVQAPLWGFGRAVALEHPERWGGLIDLEPGDPAAQAEQVLAELLAGESGVEDQVAWRDGGRHVPRLVRRALPEASPMRWRRDGAHLVTGGLGRVGLAVALWLARGGVPHLVLAGRGGLPDRAEWESLVPGDPAAHRVARVREIEAFGATVTVLASDVGDADDLATLIAGFGTRLPVLRGVWHAAGDLGTVELRALSITKLSALLRAKVAGAWGLHQATAAADLDAFVLFSSVAALWAGRGMAAYAAANAFLDALAHHRRAQGRPALSVNWGLWTEEAGRERPVADQAARAGLRPMRPEHALALLDRLLATDCVQATVCAADWNSVAEAYGAQRSRPIFDRVAAPPTMGTTAGIGTTSASVGVVQPPLLSRWLSCPEAQRSAWLVAFTRDEVADVLGYAAPEQLDIRRGLFDQGLDSLLVLRLRPRLEAALGEPIPTAVIFSHPNIEALAGFLSGRLSASAGQPSAQPAAPSAAAQSSPPAATVTTDEADSDLMRRFEATMAAIATRTVEEA